MRKYWTKTRPKTSEANSKLSLSMSDIKALFRSPDPFRFVDYSTLFSLGLVLQSISSSPWQVSHDSEIFNILGSPTKSRLHLHSFIQWPLWTSIQGLPWHVCLKQLPFAAEGNSKPLSCILACKARTMWLKLPSPSASWGGAWPPCSTTFLSASGFWWFLSLPKL